MALARAAQIGKGALRDTELLEAASRFGELDHMSTLRNKSQIDFSIAVCDLCVCVSPTVDFFCSPPCIYWRKKHCGCNFPIHILQIQIASLGLRMLYFRSPRSC